MSDIQVQTETCSGCGHQHTGVDLAYICIGCPCPLTPGKIRDAIAAAVEPTVDPNGAPLWLTGLCNPRETLEAIRAPFPFMEDGTTQYAVATDKRCLIAVRGAFDMRPAPEGFIDEAKKILALPTVETTVSFARFAEWTARAADGPPPACPKCNGVRLVRCGECDGTGEVECACACGDEHTADCDDCDQNHQVRCDCVPAERVVLGRVGEKFVNLALMAAYVPHLPATDDVRVGGIADPNSPAYFWTDDWRVIVMPHGQVGAAASTTAEAL